MKLRWNASWKPGKIEILIQPGDVIDVPDEIGKTLARAYERFEVVKSGSKEPGPSALKRAQQEGTQAAEDAEAAQVAADAAATAPPAPRRPRKRSTSKRSTSKRTSAKAKA